MDEVILMYNERPCPDPKCSCNDTANLLAEFALCMNRGDTPDSPAAQSVVEQWNACTCGNGCDCTSIPTDADSYGAGTAKYMTDAIEFYKNKTNYPH